jgi:hypothetical protein
MYTDVSMHREGSGVLEEGLKPHFVRHRYVGQRILSMDWLRSASVSAVEKRQEVSFRKALIASRAPFPFLSHHYRLLDYPVALKSPGVIEIPFSLVSLPFLGFGIMGVMFGIPNRLQF